MVLGLHVAGAAARGGLRRLFEEAEFEEVVDAHLDEVPPRAGLDGDSCRLTGCSLDLGISIVLVVDAGSAQRGDRDESEPG